MTLNLKDFLLTYTSGTLDFECCVQARNLFYNSTVLTGCGDRGLRGSFADAPDEQETSTLQKTIGDQIETCCLNSIEFDVRLLINQ